MGRKTKLVDPRVVIAQNHLSGKIVAFCETYLNQECQKLCLKLLDTWATHDPEALLRGKPEVSAAAVVHTMPRSRRQHEHWLSRSRHHHSGMTRQPRLA